MTFLQRHASPKLLMGQQAPQLEVSTIQGRHWSLGAQQPKNYTMIVFYRGLHCPVCSDYLSDLEKHLEWLTSLGVNVIAISGDSQEAAMTLFSQSKLENLTVGYGLSREDMQRWGLYMSQGHFDSEPTLFSEPALFLVKPDGALYLANIGTHPFSRPGLDLLISGVEYVIENRYPDRGTEF